MTDNSTRPQAKTSVPQPNPALHPLLALVGEWEMQVSQTSFLPHPFDTAKESVFCSFVQDGAFLLVHMGDQAKGEYQAFWLIGRDEAASTYTLLYYDARRVSRVYQMSLQDRIWKIWREAPGFWQRYEGLLSEDGKTITARWEKSNDGTSWEHDFDVMYTKIS